MKSAAQIYNTQVNYSVKNFTCCCNLVHVNEAALGYCIFDLARVAFFVIYCFCFPVPYFMQVLAYVSTILCFCWAAGVIVTVLTEESCLLITYIVFMFIRITFMSAFIPYVLMKTVEHHSKKDFYYWLLLISLIFVFFMIDTYFLGVMYRCWRYLRLKHAGSLGPDMSGPSDSISITSKLATVGLF